MFRAGVPGCFPPRSTLRSFPLISFISASLKCNSDCSDCTCGTSSISMSSYETFHRASVKLVCRTFLDSSFSRSLWAWAFSFSRASWVCRCCSFSWLASFRESRNTRISPFFIRISSSTSFSWVRTEMQTTWDWCLNPKSGETKWWLFWCKKWSSGKEGSLWEQIKSFSISYNKPTKWRTHLFLQVRLLFL